MAAGTPQLQLATLMPPYALPCAIPCRTDTPGELRHSYRPSRPSATAAAYKSLPRSPSPQQQPCHWRMFHPVPGAVPTTSCRGKKGILSLTVSAPNRSNRDNSLQNPDPGLDRHRDSERPTPGPVKRLTCHRAAASISAASALLPRAYERRLRRVLHPHVRCLLRPVFQPSRRFTAKSCPPTSIQFPPSRPEPGLSTECSLFSSNRGAIHPCFSYEFAPSRRLVSKLNLLYSPFTWSTSLHFGGAWRVHHLIYLTGDVRRIDKG